MYKITYLYTQDSDVVDEDMVYTTDEFNDCIKIHKTMWRADLTPTYPNYIYFVDLPRNMQRLLNDAIGRNRDPKLRSRTFKHKSLVSLMTRLNNVRERRQSVIQEIIACLLRISGIECTDLIDKNVFDIIVAYRGSPMVFDAKTLRISISRYHITQTKQSYNSMFW